MRTGWPRAGAYLVGDTLYLIGGLVETGRAPVEKLAPPYSTWVDVANSEPPMYASFERAGDVFGTKIVISGGASTPQVGIFDTATATWTTGAGLPASWPGFTAGAGLDGKLYVLGGLVGDISKDEPISENPDVFAYDVAAGSWSKVATLPPSDKEADSSVHEHAAVVLGGKIVSFGGDRGGKTVVVFDPATAKVSRYDNALIEARTDHVAAVVNEKVYLIGGVRPETDDALVATIEVKAK